MPLMIPDAPPCDLQVIDRPVGLDDVQVHLIETFDDASAFMRWLSERDEVGFDTETTGLDPDTSRARLVQFGDDRHGWAIPVERAGWGGLVRDAVRRYAGRYVMHNAPYDRRIMLNDGVDIPTARIDDTLKMAHVLSSTEPLALKWQASRYVDARAAQAQAALDEALNSRTGGWTWETVPIDFQPYWAYAAIDAVLTYQLKQHHYPRVMRDAPLSYELEMAVSWVCERMERRGVWVDRDYVRAFADELERFIEESTRWCHEVYGVHPGRVSQLIDALQRDGVELTKMTRSGARPSLDKYVLEDVVARYDHPLARVVLDRKRAETTHGTYLMNYLRFSERDGFIHPSINPVGGKNKNHFETGGSGAGVRTGRMSMNDPNLQNVPIRTTFGDRIRRSFGPRPDHLWVKSDFDQIEMRLLAWISNDPGMIEAFNSPGDFFVNMARNIFQDPTIVKSDPRRQPVKNSGYAKIYGAGIEQFARTAGMRAADGQLDLAGATAFLRRFDELYPGAARLARDVEAFARQRRIEEGDAYVRSPITRRRHVADPHRLYALVNYMIQGAAGEVMKMKIVEADAAGLGGYMLFPVHDEIDMDVPIADAGDVVATLRSVMNDDALLGAVPISASIAVGERWGRLVELEEAV